MHITKERLQQIIREELERVDQLDEGFFDFIRRSRGLSGAEKARVDVSDVKKPATPSEIHVPGVGLFRKISVRLYGGRVPGHDLQLSIMQDPIDDAWSWAVVGIRGFPRFSSEEHGGSSGGHRRDKFPSVERAAEALSDWWQENRSRLDRFRS